MKTDFDLEKVGKRMPYSVPDDFFDTLEADILSQVNLPSTDHRSVRRVRILRLWTRGIAVAATLALLFWVGDSVFTQQRKPDLQDVELAFNELSDEDQNYLLTVYREDIFMNE